MKTLNNNSSSNSVLIIEDDTAQMHTLADIIQSEGFHPVCCHSDKEAFRILKKNRINVAILDLKLGDVDGVTVFRKLRSEYPGIKVIIHTAHASIESAVAAVNEEAFAYVTKMSPVEELISHVHRAFREHFADYTEILQKEVDKSTAELRKANDDLKNEIIERKRAEVALRESEALYTALFQHNPIQTIFVDNEGKVVGFNRAKQSSGDRLPKIGDVMYRDYASQHKIDMYEQLINCIKTGRMGEFPEMEYFDKVLSIKISPFEKGAIITSQDITERTRLLQQLIHSEKLASVGQLAAGVAHEFNNLLTVVLGRAQIAMEEDSVEEIRESLRVIENTSKRGSALVKNLSAFARPKEPRFKLQDITELIDEVIKFQKRQLQLENIEIEKEFDAEAKVSFDWGQMEQVFLNLLINAIHAIKPRGKGTIKITVKDAENRVRISFSDTGIGMDESTRLKIFDPFFSTKGAWANDGLGIPGTGLGLSVSHAIIKKHNGTIHVKSTKGKGTSFIITLPAAVSGRAHKEPQRAKIYNYNIEKIKNMRILIVDDEKEMVDLMRLAFKKAGFKNVCVEDNGEQALTIFKVFNPDIVFLDLLMPDMSGENVYHKIKLLKEDIPVVFMSGKLGMEKTKFATEGVYEFIQKPFDVNEIFDILHKYASSDKKKIETA